jgi:hypothetical protein
MMHIPSSSDDLTGRMHRNTIFCQVMAVLNYFEQKSEELDIQIAQNKDFLSSR